MKVAATDEASIPPSPSQSILLEMRGTVEKTKNSVVCVIEAAVPQKADEVPAAAEVGGQEHLPKQRAHHGVANATVAPEEKEELKERDFLFLLLY